MNARVINVREADLPLYMEFVSWWEAHGWPAVPVVMLPKCGVVVEAEGVPMAAAWLYLDASETGVCFLSWVVTRPGLKAKKAAAVVAFLAGAARAVADELGYSQIITLARHGGLVAAMRRQGFTSVGKGVLHQILIREGKEKS